MQTACLPRQILVDVVPMPESLQCYCREEAVRCLGLLGLLPGSTEAEASSSQRLALLRTALSFDSAPQVQEMAAQALCDLALLRCSLYHTASHDRISPLLSCLWSTR